jgi:hypothetical protein
MPPGHDALGRHRLQAENSLPQCGEASGVDGSADIASHDLERRRYPDGGAVRPSVSKMTAVVTMRAGEGCRHEM